MFSVFSFPPFTIHLCARLNVVIKVLSRCFFSSFLIFFLFFIVSLIIPHLFGYPMHVATLIFHDFFSFLLSCISYQFQSFAGSFHVHILSKYHFFSFIAVNQTRYRHHFSQITMERDKRVDHVNANWWYISIKMMHLI